MLEVAFSSSFKKAFKKKIKNNQSLEEKFWEKLAVFIENPFDKRLRAHKLSGKLETLWSFSIEPDCRIIFTFAGKKQVIFIDIGKHEEVY